MTVYFVALKYDTTYGALNALDTVRAAEELGYTWIDDVAIIERHHSGRIATHTPHGSVKSGAAFGTLLGALVGVFFPPAGFLALAGLGAGTGALIEKASKEASVPEDLFDEVKDNLEDGTSALLVLGETTVLGEAQAAFAGTYAREMIRELDEGDVEQMKQKLVEDDGS